MFRLIQEEEDSDIDGSKYSCDMIMNTHPDDDSKLRLNVESLERNKTHESVITHQYLFNK